MSETAERPLQRSPLYELHVELGAKMVPFAGYDMPLSYPSGILAEHRHTRTKAGLFDVSHMGQVRVSGADPAAAIEALVPGDIQGLRPGRVRYTLFTNDEGGILDDLIVTKAEDHLVLVVNAACTDGDVAHLRAALGDRCEVALLGGRALLALQGPAAAAVLERHAPASTRLAFMTATAMPVAGIDCMVSRSGYTGEDGFEISLSGDDAPALARLLLREAEVKPAGLGARDSLRLEAGLCLYGHDIDTTTTPVEAGLAWTIAKRRRAEASFPGAETILEQIRRGTARKRVGILVEGGALAREHTPIVDGAGAQIGTATSGGFAATLGRPIAMGYVSTAFAEAETAVGLIIRNKTHPGRVASMPFVPPRYAKGVTISNQTREAASDE